MSFGLSDVFGSSREDDGYKAIPDTPEQKKARSFLLDQMNNNVIFPTQKTAGLSSNENTTQSLLGKYLGSGGLYSQANNEISNTLGGDTYDPINGAYYQGLRGEADRLKSEGIGAINRRSQIGWGSPSRGTAVRAVGDYTSQVNNQLLQQLGSLYENERQNRLSAANSAYTMPMSSLNQAENLASVPRSVQQQQYDAAYNKALQELLFPYNTQASIAGQILGEPRYAYDSGTTSPSLFSQITGGIGGILGGMNSGGRGGYTPQQNATLARY